MSTLREAEYFFDHGFRDILYAVGIVPAKVARVFSDPATKTIQAVVDEDQLSLAIGRNGQNVRLASVV